VTRCARSRAATRSSSSSSVASASPTTTQPPSSRPAFAPARPSGSIASASTSGGRRSRCRTPSHAVRRASSSTTWSTPTRTARRAFSSFAASCAGTRALSSSPCRRRSPPSPFACVRGSRARTRRSSCVVAGPRGWHRAAHPRLAWWQTDSTETASCCASTRTAGQSARRRCEHARLHCAVPRHASPPPPSRVAPTPLRPSSRPAAAAHLMGSSGLHPAANLT
jgi:hypothetical protein